MGLLFNRGSGCDGHHFGEGVEKIWQADIHDETTPTHYENEKFYVEVVRLEIPVVATCQHDGCHETKEIGTKTRYIHKGNVVKKYEVGNTIEGESLL